MPDFLPLFDGSNRRVFDGSGKPVFARIRTGSIDVTITATGSWNGNYSIPAGSVNGSFSASFARTSYGAFASPSLPGTWVNYLGKYQDTTDYWLILKLEYLAFGYSQAAQKFLLYHSWRCWPHTDPANTSGSPLGTNTRAAQSVKSSSLLFPEGAYAPDWTSYSDPDGCSIAFPATLSLVFTET